jgi:hypothetical protein
VLAVSLKAGGIDSVLPVEAKRFNHVAPARGQLRIDEGLDGCVEAGLIVEASGRVVLRVFPTTPGLRVGHFDEELAQAAVPRRSRGCRQRGPSRPPRPAYGSRFRSPACRCDAIQRPACRSAEALVAR